MSDWVEWKPSYSSGTLVESLMLHHKKYPFITIEKWNNGDYLIRSNSTPYVPTRKSIRTLLHAKRLASSLVRIEENYTNSQINSNALKLKKNVHLCGMEND